MRPRRSNASLIMRRLEEVSLQPVQPPVPPPPMEDTDLPGLPSYEQAVTKSGQHDAPPPPYPGYLCLQLKSLDVKHKQSSMPSQRDNLHSSFLLTPLRLFVSPSAHDRGVFGGSAQGETHVRVCQLHADDLQLTSTLCCTASMWYNDSVNLYKI